MSRQGKSAAAGFIDKLEREVLAVRPLAGPSPWHCLTGACTGAALAFWLSVRGIDRGDFAWGWLVVGAVVGGLSFGLAGRALWNQLLAAHYAGLQEQARANILERELLFLALADDLPARYEHFRFAAQSYGKTRARNWNERRKGSMQDRLSWLVENYQELCRIERLPVATPQLQRWTSWCIWLMLAPCGGLAVAIAAVAGGWLPRELNIALVLLSVGLLFAALGAGGGIAAMLSRLQRVALLSVMVEQLDVDLAQPAADS